jgi:hypothetical protein
MLEMYANGTFATDATDPRNLFHERALSEARIASEYHQHTVEQPRTASLFARVRAALAGAQGVPTTEVCGCPA